MIRRIKTNLGVEDVDVDPCLTEEEDDGDEEDMYYECSEPISSGVEHAPELPAQLKQVEAADKCGRGEEIECDWMRVWTHLNPSKCQVCQRRKRREVVKAMAEKAIAGGLVASQ